MSLPEPKSFRFEVTRGVGRITLDRPDVMNALTFEVYGELAGFFRAIGDSPEVRALVITGEGRAFCSGGDVDDIIGNLFTRDGAGRILLSNDAAVRLLGADSQEDLLGTTLQDLWGRFALYAADGRPMRSTDLSWMRALQDERPAPMLMRRVNRGTGAQQRDRALALCQIAPGVGDGFQVQQVVLQLIRLPECQRESRDRRSHHGSARGGRRG